MKLIFKTGLLAGKKFEAETEVTLGRDPSNDIVIPDSSVSLVHCRLYVDGDRVLVNDLGSTNGTTLNGHRVITADLQDGDCLVIGQSEITVQLPPGQVFVPAKETEKTKTAQILPAATVFRDDFIIRPEDGDRHPGGELSGNIFGAVTYYLKRKIADGGMGSVYEADQFGAEGFIKKVAIKTILPTYVQKTSFVTSFINEAKVVANLVHQNIVQIHHLGRHEGGYYIAMEFIDGINLTRFMILHGKLKRYIPFEIATFIVSRICRGLEYAHSKCDEQGNLLGLVHRDVSPNNIMITREGEVKLTDFGVAKAAQFMELDDGYLVGSVEYMSPEQAACRKVDARSDIYSLGLVYYELLTGVRIFQCEGNDIDSTVARVKESKIPNPLDYRKNIPKGIVDVLTKCLQKLPEDRYETAGELGYALEEQIYSKGFGPTIVTLAGYLNELGKAITEADL